MIESAEQFVCLRTSEDTKLYQRAASESATDEIWQEVIEKYPEMRVWVARNKNVSVKILGILSQDENPDVRYAVAMKCNSGQEILQRLAQDTDESVRLRVALNPKTPKIVLELLLQDKWSRVVQEAKNRLEEDFTV
jgi:hypothetical protein